MPIFTCNQLAKSYHNRLLFENVSFGLDDGDRVGIIGRNGAGKTTLLRIIAGEEQPDTGQVVFNKSARFRYLPQLPSFDRHANPLDTVLMARPDQYRLLKEYDQIAHSTSPDTDRLAVLAHDLDATGGWNLEQQAREMLHRLGVTDFSADVTTLSGGQRKRIALAQVLLSDPDLLILDEPTNHLDADTVQWLQDVLQQSPRALLLITHDRYFLDAVSNRILELDRQSIIHYPGNYEQFLERKEAVLEAEEAAQDHLRNKLRTELAWLQRGARARRTKQKSRIDWIASMQAAPKPPEEKKIKIELGNQFLGAKVIDAINIGKSLGEKLLFKSFTLVTSPGDRIGIIGPNGSGKTTLLKVLAGVLPPDTGTLKIGQTVNLAWFRQEIDDLQSGQTVIGSLKEIAEYIDVGVGRDRYLTAKDLLDQFLFSPNQHHAKVDTLSGGERRRLSLLRLLMRNPNVLLLDEPTNDFDLDTLGALENYLQNFGGCLLVVSHDRSFLDKTVDTILAFEPGGVIKTYPGNYSAYLDKKEARENEQSSTVATKPKAPAKPTSPATKSGKLSYKETRELEQLDRDIQSIEDEKASLTEQLHLCGESDYKKLMEISNRIEELDNQLEEKFLRWMELSEQGKKS
ncbi:MAG: ABC-F family ATP-binding cassette domain-containing protein [Bacteroidetes bacterium]|nr:ABC-F family ATP-binding cassette domain-containing protein [Bacteroidota bacterium]